MRKILTENDIEAAVKGGSVYAAGGGGWADHGRMLGAAAMRAGKPELVSIDELPDDAWVATAAAIGAPASTTAWEMQGMDYVKAVQLLQKELGAPIAGLMIGQNGRSSTLNGWLPAAIFGCKVLDAVGDMRAHPTGDMGSIGLAGSSEPTIQTAVGGNRAENRYMELVVKGATAKVSPVLRTAADMSGGFIASCRNPVRAAYVAAHAALGGISKALALGEAILAAERKGGGATLDAICKTTGGAIIGEGAVTRKNVLYTNEAFDVGVVEIGAGAKALRLHVMNEYMAIDDADGRRIATFPDVIATLRADGEPLSVGQLREDDEVVVFHVPKSALPLSSSVIDPAVYPPVERAMGIEIARYALAGASPMSARAGRNPRFPIPGGAGMRARGWRQEGLLRLLENVLCVGEDPDNLVVYAALGKAARNWAAHEAIVSALTTMNEGETLVVQSGKPIGLLATHPGAPLVIMANCNIVGQWANAATFYELEKKGLICWGGLTAGAWQYIGSQGVLQGTYEIFMRVAERRFGGNLAGRFVLTAGLGGMGGAQPLAGRMAGAAILCVEVDPERARKRQEIGYLERIAPDLDTALAMIEEARAAKTPLSVALIANAAAIYPELVRRGVTPDVVTDQTAAHDLVYGYIPRDVTLEEARALRKSGPDRLMAASRASIAEHVRAMLEFQRRGAEVFDNGNLIRTQAKHAGVADAFAIPVFTEAYLRPLFARAIGPFRWMALSGEEADIARIDDLVLEMFPGDRIVANWIRLARMHVPFEGLPARIAWLGHGARTDLALAVNALVASGELAAPVAFSRDHLDAAAMAHPNIMTENMKDGSDAIADWPLLDAMALCSSMADLVAVHSGGGGYAGTMTSAGVTMIADGTDAAAARLSRALTNDTALGVMRYADAGYEAALDEAARKNIRRFALRG